MGIPVCKQKRNTKDQHRHLYHNQDVLQLDLPDLLPPDGDWSPRRPLQICSPSSYQDDSRAGLLRHVVPGAALKARDVPHGTTPVKTAGGEEIEVTRNRYITIKSSAGEAGVIAFDILATNGVVHLVNSVF